MQKNKSINNNLYDQFYIDRTFNSERMKQAADREIEWLVQKLKLPKNSKILDVACGAGRHLKAFVSRGYAPYGVDFSPSCIDAAKLNCPDIEERIVEANFIEFASKTEIKFDLVFVGGVSFGYEPTRQDNQEYLEAMLEVLSENGILVLQFLNKSWALNNFQKKTTSWSESSEHFCLDKRDFIDNQLVSDRIYLFKDGKDEKRYSDKVYLFSLSEINSFFSESLSSSLNLQVFDGFSDAEFCNETSAFPIIIIKK